MTSTATYSRQLLREENVRKRRGLDRISRENFEPASRNFTAVSGTIRPTNKPDMRSLAASSRLQNAVEYCIKVRKTGPAAKNRIVQSSTRSPTNDRECLHKFSSWVARRFAWPNQLVGFLFLLQDLILLSHTGGNLVLFRESSSACDNQLLTDLYFPYSSK